MLRRSRPPGLPIAAVAALLVALACVPRPGPPEPQAWSTSGPTVAASVESAPAIAPVPASVASVAPLAAQTSPAAQLAEVITAHLGAYEDQVGVVVEHVESGGRFEHNAERRFASASLYKLAVAYEALRQVDQGRLSLDDVLTIDPVDTLEQEPGDLTAGETVTLRLALELMLGDSSNVTAFALMRLVGRPHLNATLVQLGLRQTSVPLLVGDIVHRGSEPLDDEYAVTSAADMAELLRLLATDQLLTPASRQELFRLLAQAEPVDPLRDGVPGDAAVLAKTGNLPGANNIAGLIRTTDGSVVVSVLTEAVDPDHARAMIEDIGRIAYQLHGGSQFS